MRVFNKISHKYGLTKEELTQEYMKRVKLIYELYRRKIFDFEDVQKVINQYYKSPESVLRAYNLV